MRIKTLLPLLFTLLTFTGAYAQWNVVQETQRNMSFGTRPCFRLEFAGTDASVVEDNFKDYVKNTFNGKLKKDKRSGEWFATALKASMMGDEPFGVYATTEKMSDGVALNIWIDEGSYFLNRRENGSRTEEVSRSLRTFYYDVRRAAIAKTVKEQEAKLKDMENKQKKMEKEHDWLLKDIESYKAKIKKAEDDVAKNEKDQEVNILDTNAQKRVIEEAKRRLDNVENERN